MEKKPKNLWKNYDTNYQHHITISAIDPTNEDEGIVYIEDLEKRKEVYGICGECYEPGTGQYWCQPCNAKRLKDNFKNWTSGNKDIDELIQQSQLNALHWSKCLEWIPFEKFQNITYIAEGGFGKVYSAERPEGNIDYWDIEKQIWVKQFHDKYALKSLNNSSDICSDFLNEIKSHLQIYLNEVISCFGITQDPNTKEYMMVLFYCDEGNLRNYINESETYISYRSKIDELRTIAQGLLDIHNSGFVHKDFHSGNILFYYGPFISDLGMCQPANKRTVKEEGTYGVLPYVAPEVLRGHQYTKAADIYSFGIIMNEFLSEEIPFNDIPHDKLLAIQICKGYRPKISKDVPKLLANLIIKCWDAEIENRPTAKELYQMLEKWNNEIIDIEGSEDSEDNKDNEDNEVNEDNEDKEEDNEDKEDKEDNKDNEDNEDNEDSEDNVDSENSKDGEDNGDNENNEDSEDVKNSQNSEIYSQVKECDEIRRKKFESKSNKDKSINIQTHPQAIYTSRLLNFKNLPKPVNSSDLSSLQFNSANPCSAQLSESDDPLLASNPSHQDSSFFAISFNLVTKSGTGGSKAKNDANPIRATCTTCLGLLVPIVNLIPLGGTSSGTLTNRILILSSHY
ncbi:hypothetical protein RclHR1_00690034 [Rhizophagus clarus]|uniref:Protein kinase domain-containing protein n=1 Tax=Rhizophagus clarus TaxID=94130 RepID=A0A2Z6RUY0_9GLOM|nr:hypothetical protein RclHR1_00690034 [Rhizophagus clarus]